MPLIRVRDPLRDRPTDPIWGLYVHPNSGDFDRIVEVIFEFIPYEFIHTAGLIAIVFLSNFGLIGIIRMIITVGRANNQSMKSFVNGEKMNW